MNKGLVLGAVLAVVAAGDAFAQGVAALGSTARGGTSQVGRTLAELTAVLLGVGMIVGAFQATGLTGPLATELIFLAGDSIAMRSGILA